MHELYRYEKIYDSFIYGLMCLFPTILSLYIIIRSSMAKSLIFYGQDILFFFLGLEFKETELSTNQF